MAPVFPPAIPNIDYGGRIRGLLKLQNPQNPKEMNVPGQEITADLYMSGQVHRYFKWLVSVEMSYKGVAGESQAGAVEPLDLIARFEPMPEFNIYLGRMLVVVDRFAPSGPWGVDEFFFPGFFPLIGPPALPKAGPIGRDVGTSIWGAPLKGHIKYYVGMFNLNNPNPGAHPPSNPLFNGRLQVSLLNGEPNWFHRATYYGSKDLISAGVGTAYQRGGSAQPAPPPPAAGMPAPPPPKRDDYQVVSGDLTAEKNIGNAGTASLIGQYTTFIGDYNPWKNFMLVEAGYMLPEPIGIGKPRLSARYQRALAQPPGAKASQVIDVQLSYLIAAWYARLGLGYRHGDSWLASSPAATKPSNMLYLGVIVGDP
jgi:hypothetical protein